MMSPEAEHRSMSEPARLYANAVSNLPRNKPLVFTNLLRFHGEARYKTPYPSSLSSAPTPCSGKEAYWTRYFPIYHTACRETLGDEADTLQRVLYKGDPLLPLRLPTSKAGLAGMEEGHWHAVVMTRVESWEVAERVAQHEEYKNVASYHRAAAVEDDALFVSCPVEGFEMQSLE